MRRGTGDHVQGAHFNLSSFQCLNYYCACFLFRIGSLQAAAANKLHLSSSLNKSSTTAGMADSGVTRAENFQSRTYHLRGEVSLSVSGPGPPV